MAHYTGRLLWFVKRAEQATQQAKERALRELGARWSGLGGGQQGCEVAVQHGALLCLVAAGDGQ